MKRIIIIGTALIALCSFKAYKNYQLSEAITNVQDMKEWMLQDIESGNIKPEIGKDYVYWLDNTEDLLIDAVKDGTVVYKQNTNNDR